MSSKLLIRDVTLRDGQQSMFATRMSQAQVDRVLPFYREAGFYGVEVWGGAVPDSVMRYLNEDPWQRLEKIKAALGDSTHLTALSRGRNLFGYSPYPEEVIEGFNRLAIQSGISIMRIFDALNDITNMETTIRYVRENGGIADCAVCYTVDPHFAARDKVRAFFSGKKLPENIFTTEYFVDLAVRLEKMGAGMITVKDMAGLITPGHSAELVSELKKAVKIPVDFHTHCTPGYGLASTLMAIINGADIVDTSMLNFSGGTAAPAFEIIQIFATRLGLETGVNLTVVDQINDELREIRKELAEFDSGGALPRDINISSYKLPPEIDKKFDAAITAAREGSEHELLDICHAIELWFNLPAPDEHVRKAEIPGGMYSNMLAQLKQLKLDDQLNKALELVPMVRLKAGCPPLVTPTSQIVGVEAVNCAIDENNNQPWFTTNSVQFVNLVKGSYGKTPIPVDPDFREKICGHRDEQPYDTSNYQKQPNPEDEIAGVKLAQTEKEELLLELFPTVALGFLQTKLHRIHQEMLRKIEDEKRIRNEKAKAEYENLSPEEKGQRVLGALYSSTWATSHQE